MAKPRGRDGEVEVESAGGDVPEASPWKFLKKWCQLVHSETILETFLCFKISYL